jgi:acyl-CoA synthetase
MPNTILTLLSAAKLHGFYAAGFWRDDTIYSLTHGHAETSPDKFAIRDRLRRLTYRELVAAADRLAADLHARGLRCGDRVAVWLPSRIETAITVIACSRNGYVCCPSLHRDHTVGEIAALLERTRARALVAETGYGADAHRHSIFETAAAIASLKAIYRLDPLGEAAPPLLWPDAVRTDQAPVSADADTIVYLAFTSGTTGAPKGVMHSDNTLLANARALASDWNLTSQSVIYSLSPLSHNLGFGALVMTLMAGAEFVVHDVPAGHGLVDRIVATEATFMIGVPTHAIDLLAELRARGLRSLGRVKGFRISGAAVPPSVAADLIEHGVVPQSGYGMTEAGSHNYTLPNDASELICETSGRACAGYEIAIFAQDDSDVELPPSEVGEIGGRGASLMLGYFDDQEATETAFNATGWFMTGDLGWIDDVGYLRITGRTKDLIIRGGHNIYPARIESLALRHPAIERAAAVPIADERLGEKVCLAVVARDGQRPSGEEMLDHLDACGLSKFDMPEYFLALDHMPLTASGKVLKRDLVAAIGDGRLRPLPVHFKPKVTP